MRFLLLFSLLLITGCGRNMWEQPKIHRPYQATEAFEDGSSARPLPEGTVARGFLRTDEHFYTGMVDGQLSDRVPFPVTEEVLERGRQRYDIFCSVCHGRLGDGGGVAVRHGFPQPQSFHIERLRQSPTGYYYWVITNGFGRMYSYADRLRPEDRWAIAAYIRALQLSQQVALEELPPEEREALERME